MAEDKKITKDSLIGEVVSRHPETADVMLGYGLHCVGCHVSAFETIEQGAKSHGLDDKKISEMLKEMETAVKEIREKDISLSESAAKKFSELMEKEGKKGYGLKLSLVKGNCSGEQYDIDFCKGPAKGDSVFDEKGHKIFVPKELLSSIRGTRISYLTGLFEGFRIYNPNASKCGTC